MAWSRRVDISEQSVLWNWRKKNTFAIVLSRQSAVDSISWPLYSVPTNFKKKQVVSTRNSFSNQSQINYVSLARSTPTDRFSWRLIRSTVIYGNSHALFLLRLSIDATSAMTPRKWCHLTGAVLKVNRNLLPLHSTCQGVLLRAASQLTLMRLFGSWGIPLYLFPVESQRGKIIRESFQ